MLGLLPASVCVKMPEVLIITAFVNVRNHEESKWCLNIIKKFQPHGPPDRVSGTLDALCARLWELRLGVFYLPQMMCKSHGFPSGLLMLSTVEEPDTKISRKVRIFQCLGTRHRCYVVPMRKCKGSLEHSKWRLLGPAFFSVSLGNVVFLLSPGVGAYDGVLHLGKRFLSCLSISLSFMLAWFKITWFLSCEGIFLYKNRDLKINLQTSLFFL